MTKPKLKLRPLYIFGLLFFLWFMTNLAWMVRITAETRSSIKKQYAPMVQEGKLKKTPKVLVDFPHFWLWPFSRKAVVSYKLDYTSKYLHEKQACK